MNDTTVKIALSYSLGADLHEDWRKTRLKNDGSYEPRIKNTKDEEWTKQHGTNTVDIANSTFSELPSDWQKENLAAATVVIELVYDKVMADKTITAEDIEKMAAVIHEEWLKRNLYVFRSIEEGGRPDLAVSYAELEESEKEKDRKQIAPAVKRVQDYKNGLIDINSICEEYKIQTGYSI